MQPAKIKKQVLQLTEEVQKAQEHEEMPHQAEVDVHQSKVLAAEEVHSSR